MMRKWLIILAGVVVPLCLTAANARDLGKLIDQASMAYEIGDYAACAEKLAEAIRLGARSADNYYNLACCFSLNEQPDEALACLDQALDLGYRDIDHLKVDADLYSLHPFDQWAAVLEKCRANQEKYLAGINRELYRLYQEDQADRTTGEIDWSLVEPRDRRRRERVQQLLDSGLVNTADDFFHAGMIFQHGTDSADYALAYELADYAFAIDSNHASARWLTAAAKDRYLLSTGQPQWYGTQFHLIDGKWTIEPIDTTAVTDDERRRMGCRTLSEARKHAALLNGR